MCFHLTTFDTILHFFSSINNLDGKGGGGGGKYALTAKYSM